MIEKDGESYRYSPQHKSRDLIFAGISILVIVVIYVILWLAQL